MSCVASLVAFDFAWHLFMTLYADVFLPHVMDLHGSRCMLGNFIGAHIHHRRCTHTHARMRHARALILLSGALLGPKKKHSLWLHTVQVPPPLTAGGAPTPPRLPLYRCTGPQVHQPRGDLAVAAGEGVRQAGRQLPPPSRRGGIGAGGGFRGPAQVGTRAPRATCLADNCLDGVHTVVVDWSDWDSWEKPLAAAVSQVVAAAARKKEGSNKLATQQ